MEPDAQGADLLREAQRLPLPLTGIGFSDQAALTDTIAGQMRGVIDSTEEEEVRSQVRAAVGPLLELPAAMRRAKFGRVHSLVGASAGGMLWRYVL